ncbi:hypothetical protein BDR26DRAFT_955066 [Obelidium mucronatum]|nr:hypothetical protein BDR26DRAFT_955066 [Obelidium mucronatum]
MQERCIWCSGQGAGFESVILQVRITVASNYQTLSQVISQVMEKLDLADRRAFKTPHTFNAAFGSSSTQPCGTGGGDSLQEAYGHAVRATEVHNLWGLIVDELPNNFFNGSTESFMDMMNDASKGICFESESEPERKTVSMKAPPPLPPKPVGLSLQPAASAPLSTIGLTSTIPLSSIGTSASGDQKLQTRTTTRTLGGSLVCNSYYYDHRTAFLECFKQTGNQKNAALQAAKVVQSKANGEDAFRVCSGILFIDEWLCFVFPRSVYPGFTSIANNSYTGTAPIFKLVDDGLRLLDNASMARRQQNC